MTWLGIAAGLLWLLVWSGFVAKAASSRDGDAQVRMFGSVLPPFSAITLLLFFAVASERGQVYRLVLGLHHAAFFALFLFLLAAQMFQAQAWWQIRDNMSSVSVAATMRRLWALTEIAPAPIAIAIFLTGLRLVWESPANSPDVFWLMALILSFSVFFFDGILGYRPIVRKMRAYWDVAATKKTPAAQAAQKWHPVSDQLQLLAHFLSWPFVFALGVFRWRTSNPFTPQLTRLQRMFSNLSEGWAAVVTALILWGSVGLVVVLVRTSLHLRNRASGDGC